MRLLRSKFTRVEPAEHVPSPTTVRNTSVELMPAAFEMDVFKSFTTGLYCIAANTASRFTLVPKLKLRQNWVTAGASAFSEGAVGAAGLVRLTARATMAPTTPSSTSTARLVRTQRCPDAAAAPPAAAALGAASLSASPSGAQHGAMCASSVCPSGDTAASRSMSAGAPPGVRGGGPAGVCGEKRRGAAAAAPSSAGLSGKGPADMLAPLRA
jgi:hypothetical protein